MVPADEARLLHADVLLERGDKVHVLLGRERHEYADRPVQAGVQQHLPAAGDHRDLVDACDEVADVEVRQQLRLVRRAHEQALFVQDARARRVVVYLLGHLGVQSVDKDVAEAIACRHGRIIDHRRARDPARLSVVREDEQPVFRCLVNGVVDRLLHVADDNAGALSVESHNGRAESLMEMRTGFERDNAVMTNLVLRFTKHFFLANIIHPQSFPHTCNQSTLESEKREGDIIYFRLRDVSVS